MGTYFNPFVGRPIDPEQLKSIRAAYREALAKTDLASTEHDAMVLAARAIRLYQIGIHEPPALVRALFWFYQMTMRSRHHQEAIADRQYTVRIRL